MELERHSDAIEPGKSVPVGTAWTNVMDADDADEGAKWVIQNNSDVNVTIRLEAAADAGSAVALEGIVLVPGGHWEEDRYSGAVSAIHAGSGNKNVSLVIV